MQKSRIKILLGSGSPRRKQLISALGFDFRVKQSHTAEIPKPGLRRGEIALFLAEEKAQALENERLPDETLITADTIVCLGDKVLNKPGDEIHAMQMLSELNGQTHQVYTGVCIISNTKKVSFFIESDVTFNKLSDEELLRYIRQYKPFDKAGSYGAQDCLPDGINICSSQEIDFMKQHNLTNLFNDSLAGDHAHAIPLIRKIEGSYFNVMGLPIVELWKELEE